MTKKTFLILLALFLMPLSVRAEENVESGKVFNARTAMLDNGMQIVVIENHRAPVVTHMLWYKVGSADEPHGDGVSGAAHFLEHLMFKGSKAIPAGEFSKLIRSIGGDDNAFTSWDFTAFFQSVPARYLPNVMALEADRMINLSLAEKDILSERDVIIEERRMRTDNDPQSLFMEKLRAGLYTNAPYAEPIIGWKDEMPKLGRDDVMNYYHTWYTPSNTILVVSGDVNFEQVRTWAAKYYGIIPSHATPDHIRPYIPDYKAETRLTLHDEDIRQPALLRAWIAPSFVEDKKVYDGLEVLCETLSGGAATKLYQKLVVEKKKATSIDLSYDGDARGQGSLWLSATPAPNVTMDELEREIDTTFREIVGNGITADEVEKAKTRMIDKALFARDSVTGPAMVVGQALAIGAALDDVEYGPKRIAAVTREDVQTLFDTYLNPISPKHTPVTGILLPKDHKDHQE
ncbi:MAG TPA: pitrilysin family protein [Alphaproteobacteria bacterium]|nr:pitrilysin family protein [Alphaproteobacteria bacterium]HNS43813.1 pitrilysin family protein [Alphaproteobacteria bacterium]